MIAKEVIEKLIKEFDSEGIYFVVDCQVGSGNKISLLIDSQEGISISECVEISRFIEHKLDRETEDFELNVSSPGIDVPLKVPQQYKKNVGRELKVVTTDDVNIKGLLTGFESDTLTLEYKEKQKIEGKKKKLTIEKKEQIHISQIKTAKVVISFK
jgi:ribosome maturation factor RimP